MIDAELLTKSPGLPWIMGVFVLMKQLLDGAAHYQKDQVMTKKEKLPNFSPTHIPSSEGSRAGKWDNV